MQYDLQISDVRREQMDPAGYEPIVEETTRGEIQMRYYPVHDTKQGVLCVGGAGGGFDTPVKGWLYPRLCKDLQEEGIAGLRVRYRLPNKLEECVLDVLAGISFLESDQVTSVALVGHSFGGAVVIQAGSLSKRVRTCVALSTQTHGAGPADELGPHCSLLLAHGLDDEILPADCSRSVYRHAREPKRLLLKDHVRHGLDEWAEELPGILERWIREELAKSAREKGEHRGRG